MKQKRRFQLHVGTASILLVFMTLCLTSFAVLSVVNANADKKLSDHLARRTSAYYAAVSEAERFIANVDAAMLDIAAYHDTQESFAAVFASPHSDLRLEAEFPVSEYQYLKVELLPVLPAKETQTSRDDGREANTLRASRVAVYQIRTRENALIFDEPYLNLPH